MVFRLVLESSGLPITFPQARVGSSRACLVRSLLGGDVFPCGVMMWMG
jgi:hypothetical protein